MIEVTNDMIAAVAVYDMLIDGQYASNRETLIKRMGTSNYPDFAPLFSKN